MVDEVLYDDGLVELDEQGITLRHYYFPLATSKRIAYTDVQKVEQRAMGARTGRGRLWGSGDLRHWAPLDLRRPTKDVAVVLDLGRFIRPVFSPDDPGRVLSLLHQQVQAAS